MVGTRLHEMALHVAHNHFPALECLKKVKHVSGFESRQPPPTNKEHRHEIFTDSGYVQPVTTRGFFAANWETLQLNERMYNFQ